MKPVMVHRFRSIFTGRQQGSAALITTIAISSILVVLFVGITAIATREIRQSINADNASRALYAAEAGVEDAVRQLSNDPSFTEPTCNSKSSKQEVAVSTGGGAANTAWVCRTVTQFNNVLEGHLEKDEAIQVDISKARLCDSAGNCTGIPNTASVRYMTIEWNDPKVDATLAHGSEARDNHYLPSYLSATVNGWGGRTALMELTATWYKNKNLAPADLTGGVFPVRTVVATPACNPNGDPCTTTDFSPWNGNSTACKPSAGNTANQPCYPLAGNMEQYSVANQQLVDQGSLLSRVSATCTNSSTASYSCKLPHNAPASISAATISNTYDLTNLTKTEFKDGAKTNYINNCVPDMAVCNVMIRIKPRYAAASYRVQFYYADGSAVKPVSLSDGYATIDVTARSGTNFRRVQAKKQLTPTIFSGLFDNTVFSGSTLCKNLVVYKDFKGAPSTIQTGSATAIPNPNAGRNEGCNAAD